MTNRKFPRVMSIKDLKKLLKKEGFELMHQKSSHCFYRHKVMSHHTLTMQDQCKELSGGGLSNITKVIAAKREEEKG